MGNLKIPKASEKKIEAEQTIQIYYDEDHWLLNSEFIRLYKEKYGLIGSTDDDTAYTKRGQIGAYFGFIEWKDIKNNQSPRRITQRGKAFWTHMLEGDTDAVYEDIMCALEEVTFGRQNYGCHTSDSDLEPLAVFFHAALELGYVSNGEFAFLLYMIDGQNETFDRAISAIRTTRNLGQTLDVPENYEKFSQPTPIAILGEWGVLQKIKVGRFKPHRISDVFLQKYRDRISELRLWNTTKRGSLPVPSALSAIQEEYTDRHKLSGNDIIPDAVYQDLVDAAEPVQTSYSPEEYIPHHPDGKNQKSNRPVTNPSIGKEAIIIAEYKCSVDESHHTFTKKDGTKYMEVHHLIPLEYQHKFKYKLDTKANLIPVCPLCHKQLHYGRIEDKTPVLTQFYNLRYELLQQSGLRVSLEELIDFYK